MCSMVIVVVGEVVGVGSAGLAGGQVGGARGWGGGLVVVGRGEGRWVVRGWG